MNIIEELALRNGLVRLTPANDEQVIAAQKKLGIDFSDEYILYLKEFGCASFEGHEFTGIAQSEASNVVNVTEQERNVNKNIPDRMYVIERAGIDGIVVWQDSAGCIYMSYPNGLAKKIADSMAEYINK